MLFFITHLQSKIPPHLFCRPINVLQGACIYIERGGAATASQARVKKEQCIALRRTAMQRIDANAVSFPRMMLPSRVQPEFKDCTRAGGAGLSLSCGDESFP